MSGGASSTLGPGIGVVTDLGTASVAIRSSSSLRSAHRSLGRMGANLKTFQRVTAHLRQSAHAKPDRPASELQVCPKFWAWWSNGGRRTYGCSGRVTRERGRAHEGSSGDLATGGRRGGNRVQRGGQAAGRCGR